MQKRHFLVLSGFVLASLILDTASAQTPLDPKLVYVQVTATQKDGRAVVGLAKENFKLYEDNVQQDIVFFSGENDPLSIGVLLDVGRSMRDEMKAVAFDGLMKDAGPNDRVLLADFTDLSLNDAVHQTLQKLLETRNKRVLVLFTMRNNPGAYSFSKVKELLKDQDIQLYVIAIPPATGSSDADILREVADLSGGAAFFPESMRSLPAIYLRIGAQMRHQYVLGYRPTNTAGNGKWRKIKVTSDTREMKPRVTLNLQSRAGYYAPTVASARP